MRLGGDWWRSYLQRRERDRDQAEADERHRVREHVHDFHRLALRRRARSVEGQCKVSGRSVQGQRKVGGRSVGGRWEVSGRPVGGWSAITLGMCSKKEG